MKNIKHIWGIFCRNSVIDQQTNNISLMESLEEMEFRIPQNLMDKKIQIPLTSDIVNYWTNIGNDTSKDAEYKVEIFDSKKEKLFEANGALKFPSGKDRLRTITRLDRMVISEKSGYYKIKTSLKKDKKSKFQTVSEIPFKVKVALDLNKK